jgi:AraC-like DNA-binding protein
MTSPHLTEAINRLLTTARESREGGETGPFFYYPVTDWAKFQAIMDRGRRKTRVLPSAEALANPKATFCTIANSGIQFFYFATENRCDFDADYEAENPTIRCILAGERTYSSAGVVLAKASAGDFVFSVSKGPRLTVMTSDVSSSLTIVVPQPPDRRFSLRNDPEANEYLRQYQKNGVIVVSSGSIRWDVHFAYVLNYAVDAALMGTDTRATDPVLREYLYLNFCKELAFLSGRYGAPQQHRAVPLKLKMAEGYIALHADKAPTVADVAAEVKLSVRNLHSLFVNFRETSPGDFIRESRLIGVRAVLSSAGPDATVAAIARSWRFRSVSRFAALYKKRFGELPSETLGGNARPA